MASTFSKEMFIRVYNDKTGEYLQVGPDADSLDLVEIKSYDDAGNQDARLTMQQGQAVLIAEAILQLYKKEPT